MSKTRRKVVNINKANSNLPRLIVIRSNRNIFTQIFDDNTGKIIVASSSLKMKPEKLSGMAKEVGKDIAKKAIKSGIDRVVLDRSKYKYHGAVKALAESARENGLTI